MGTRIGIKYLLSGKRNCEILQLEWVGVQNWQPQSASIATTPLNPKSSIIVFDPQIPQLQTKRLKILFVQMKVELAMDPQLQSNPYDSSKQFMQSQYPVPRS